MPRVGMVSVHYYERYLKRSLKAALDIAHRSGAQRLVAVSNRPELVPALQNALRNTRGLQVEIALHDNSGCEFGAYQAGLERMLSFRFDWVIFANDTFTIHSCFPTAHRKRLIAAVARPCDENTLMAAGHVDSFDRSFALERNRADRWLTTNIFALNSMAIGALGNRVHFPEIDDLISGAATQSEFFSPRLDPALAEHIGAWLFRPNANRWYEAEPLTKDNAEKFARKARAIVQEKYIAAQLEERGALFLDIGDYSHGRRAKVIKRLEYMLFNARSALRTGR